MPSNNERQQPSETTDKMCPESCNHEKKDHHTRSCLVTKLHAEVEEEGHQSSSSKCLVSSLDALPIHDLWHAVFSYLTLTEIAAISTVCSIFHAIQTRPYLWKSLYVHRFRKENKKEIVLQRSSSSTSWKKMYKARMRSTRDISTDAKRWMRPTGVFVFTNNDIGDNIESICGNEELLDYSEMASEVTPGWCYFEATIWGGASVGIVSLEQVSQGFYGWRSNVHIGWRPISFGYHSDDGALFWNDNMHVPFTNQMIPYGPVWGTTISPHTSYDVVGCGYNRQSQQLFYTLNGSFLGYTSITIPNVPYTAAVSLHSLGDRAELNFGVQPFQFDLDRFSAV